MIVNIRPRISAAYGAIDSVHSTPHTGIDVAVPEGTQLHAVADGVVRVVDHADKLGNGVILHTRGGDDIIYGHMSKVTVRPGEHVEAGDILGLSGNTGHSTGPHLHLGLLHAGQYQDPSKLVDAALRPTEGAGGGIFSKIGEMVHGKMENWLDSQWTTVTNWMSGKAYEVWNSFVAESFGICLFVAMVCLLLAMFGSKRALTWLYWDVAICIIINMLGVAIG
jgi:murein DD-endopeptidase MepM/ murein hydrolase activator NlpD